MSTKLSSSAVDTANSFFDDEPIQSKEDWKTDYRIHQLYGEYVYANNYYTPAGTVIRAYCVNKNSGEIEERFETSLEDAKVTRDVWRYLGEVVDSQAKLLKIGAWNGSVIEMNPKPPAKNYLWWNGQARRGFAFIPSDRNFWVEGLRIADVALAEGERLHIEVRDSATQCLWERFEFVVPSNSAGWRKALCEKVNETSAFIRAGQWSNQEYIPEGTGVYALEGFKGNETGNALWVPVKSAIALTLSLAAHEGEASSTGDPPNESVSPTPMTETWQGHRLLDNALPDMTGFDWEALGPGSAWHSPCYLLADRDLQAGDQLCAWAVDSISGELLKTVTLAITEDNRLRTDWPAAFARAINDAPLSEEHGKVLQAGYFADDGDFKVAESTPTTREFSNQSDLERTQVNRLWCYGRETRAFSNAWFVTNRVRAAAIPEVELAAGEAIRVLVRDATSQNLLHIRACPTATHTQPANEWIKTLAGDEFFEVGASISATGGVIAAASGNDLWVPQGSNLSVDIERVIWRPCAPPTLERSLKEGEQLHIHVRDDISGAVLGYVTFQPSSEQLTQDKWLPALAKEVDAQIGDYVRSQHPTQANADNASWWQTSQPLRIEYTGPVEWKLDADPDVDSTPSANRESSLSKERTAALPRYINFFSFEWLLCLAAFVEAAMYKKAGTLGGAWKFSHDRGFFYSKIEMMDDFKIFMTYDGFFTDLESVVQLIQSSLRYQFPESRQYAEYIEIFNFELINSKLNQTEKLNWKRFINDVLKINEWAGIELGLASRDWEFAKFICDGNKAITNFSKENSSAELHLALLSEVVAQGVRFVGGGPESYSKKLRVSFHIPGSALLQAHPAVRIFYATRDAICTDSSIQLLRATPEAQPFIPQDTLCADYGSTLQSEVYDVSGASENGVDPRTGLFHAHYPVAVLRGVDGKGPELDLTLHYSAVRANESALGDGWAFRFSSFDNRLRVLTLNSGQTISLSADDINALCKNRTLEKGLCKLSAAEADGAINGRLTCLKQVTVTYPSGRTEVLAKPAEHDDQGASEHYKAALVKKMEQVIRNCDRWIEKEKIDDKQIEAYKAYKVKVQALKADLERKALILPSASITSRWGGKLDFEWQGLKGHVRLKSVKDGDVVLLRAEHETPQAQGEYKSTFYIWPDTPEAYQVELSITDCLLKQLIRSRNAGVSPNQVVKFQYQADLTLDRVLCAVAEEDGSVEQVIYESPEKPDFLTNLYEKEFSIDSGVAYQSTLPPRVIRHFLAPGGNQRVLVHKWQWKGRNTRFTEEGATYSSIQTTELGELQSPAPFTKRTWKIQNGLHLLVEELEEVPGISRKTTSYQYPATLKKGDSPQLGALPSKTESLYEDLRAASATAKENQA